MSMCESILTIALVCTVKYLHYCDYYYTLGNDSQSTPKLIAYDVSAESAEIKSYFLMVNLHKKLAAKYISVPCSLFPVTFRHYS